MWKRPSGIAFVVLVLLTPSIRAGDQHFHPDCARSTITAGSAIGIGGRVELVPCSGLVTLYGHFGPFPHTAALNGQPPDVECEPGLNEGFVMPTVQTRNYDSVDIHLSSNTFSMRYTPSRIEFDDACASFYHSMPGLAADMTFSRPELTAYWYASADGAPTRPQPPVHLAESAPSVVPAVGVYARLETGLDPNKRRIIAEGDTGSGFGSLDASRVSSTVTMVNLPGQAPVYEFRVPMQLREGHLSASDYEAPGLVFSFTMYQLEEDQFSFTQSGWRIRCGAAFPCRLEASLSDPLQEVDAKFESSTGHLRLVWRVSSPLGSYDVDPESIQFHLMGPVSLTSAQLERPKVTQSFDHHGTTEPVRINWEQSVEELDLVDGEYELVAGIVNSQHTYRLQSSWKFEVAGGTPRTLDEKDGMTGKTYVPGLGAIMVLLVVATLMGILSDRRR